MFAIFNEDKKFVGFSPDKQENPKILCKEIPEEQSDIRFWIWEGDFDDGKMVPIGIGYPIEEIQLEEQLFKYIQEKYPLTIQLINIIKQIRKIVENDKTIQDYEFMDMSDSIINAIEMQIKRLNYYKTYERLIPKP